MKIGSNPGLCLVQLSHPTYCPEFQKNIFIRNGKKWHLFIVVWNQAKCLFFKKCALKNSPMPFKTRIIPRRIMSVVQVMCFIDFLWYSICGVFGKVVVTHQQIHLCCHSLRSWKIWLQKVFSTFYTKLSNIATCR